MKGCSNKVLDIHLPKKKYKNSKWFKCEIAKDQFKIKNGKDGKFYAHHEAWKNTIWIGPYDTEDEANKVIDSYVLISKEPFGKRKELKNVHSTISDSLMDTD